MVFLLSACAQRAPVIKGELGDPGGPGAELGGVPFFPQEDYQCGPAALATVLGHAGVRTTPGELAPQVYLPVRRGSLQVELMGATRRHGRIPYPIAPTLQALLGELDDGRPVLVLQDLGPRGYPVWHYSVVIGYLVEGDALVLRSGRTRRLEMDARTFLETWEPSGRWGMVALRPGRLPLRPEHDTYLRELAAFERVAGPEQALPAYESAVREWPGRVTPRFALARALHDMGRLNDAEVGYRELLARTPGHVPTLNNLALLLAERGCRDEALATLNSALEEAGPGERILLDTLNETRAEILSAGGSAASCP